MELDGKNSRAIIAPTAKNVDSDFGIIKIFQDESIGNIPTLQIQNQIL